MESFPSTAAAEPVPSPGAGVALVCESGQGSPLSASPEDGRRVLLPARGSHLTFTSLHTPTSTGNRGRPWIWTGLELSAKGVRSTVS